METATACAERIALFLADLRGIDPLFATWYLKSRSRKKATHDPIVIVQESLTRLLESGVNRRDIDKSPIAELGFSFGAWAGSIDSVTTSLRITCGAYNEHIQNVSLLHVTEGHPFNQGDISRIVQAAVRAWAPDLVEMNSKTVYSR